MTAVRKNISLKPYAKINLFLDVVSKRKDGFHEIRTVFSEIDLHDEINFALTDNNDVKILTDNDKIKLEDNLVYRIAIFIKQKYNVNKGCDITLKKNIPIAAGLGGGSSDAAQTIIGLNSIWDIKLSKNDMHKIAENFGSDINYFLEGGTAIGIEKGNCITPIEEIKLKHIILVNPGFAISSKQAYDLVTNIAPKDEQWNKFLRTKSYLFSYNKLEEKIRVHYKEIDEIILKMQELGAKKAILSGSGATVIGFCDSEEVTDRISTFYSSKKYWNYITKTKRRTL